MRAFISYRRTAGRPGPLVQSVKTGLDRLHEADDEAILDLSHVTDPCCFASQLVDAGLNRSDVLLAVVDDSWIEPSNLRRLLSSGRETHGSDWVEFELRYAIQHRLVIAFVGEERHLAKLQCLLWPPALIGLRKCRQFWTSASRLSVNEAEELVDGLRAMSFNNQRIPSSLIADDTHNLPASLNVLEAEVRAEAASAIISFIGTAASLIRILLIAVVAFGGLVSAALIGSGEIKDGLLILVLGLCALGTAKLMRLGWVWLLEATLRRRTAN